MSYLNRLLIFRENSFQKHFDEAIKTIESQLTIQPMATIIQLPYDSKLASLLMFNFIKGGLTTIINNGYLTSTIQITLPNFEDPLSPDMGPLLQRLVQFRQQRITTILELIILDIERQIALYPCHETISVNVYEVTNSKIDISKIVKALSDGGLPVTIQIGYTQTIIYITLPPLNDIPEDFHIYKFLKDIYAYQTTKDSSKIPQIKEWLSYHNVYAFTQAYEVTEITNYLKTIGINFDEVHTQFIESGSTLEEQIPCSVLDWTTKSHKMKYIIEELGSPEEWQVCKPLYEMFLLQ